MSEQSKQEKCPKCGQDKGKLLFSESAMDVLHGVHGDYGQRGRLSFYECQNCGHKWDIFLGDGGPLWTLPIED